MGGAGHHLPEPVAVVVREQVVASGGVEVRDDAPKVLLVTLPVHAHAQPHLLGPEGPGTSSQAKLVGKLGRTLLDLSHFLVRGQV